MTRWYITGNHISHIRTRTYTVYNNKTRLESSFEKPTDAGVKDSTCNNNDQDKRRYGDGKLW